MWDARLWWWSRVVEVATVLTCVIANRIPFNKEGVNLDKLLKGLPLYKPWTDDENET